MVSNLDLASAASLLPVVHSYQRRDGPVVVFCSLRDVPMSCWTLLGIPVMVFLLRSFLLRCSTDWEWTREQRALASLSKPTPAGTTPKHGDTEGKVNTSTPAPRPPPRQALSNAQTFFCSHEPSGQGIQLLPYFVSLLCLPHIVIHTKYLPILILWPYRN
jgi:hypothetical protein